MEQKRVRIYIKRLGTGEVVSSIPVDVPIPDSIRERIVCGLLRKVDLAIYYLDDSELDQSDNIDGRA